MMIGPCHNHLAGFKRLAKGIERRAGKLGQFVKK